MEFQVQKVSTQDKANQFTTVWLSPDDYTTFLATTQRSYAVLKEHLVKVELDEKKSVGNIGINSPMRRYYGIALNDKVKLCFTPYN